MKRNAVCGISQVVSVKLGPYVGTMAASQNTVAVSYIITLVAKYYVDQRQQIQTGHFLLIPSGQGEKTLHVVLKTQWRPSPLLTHGSVTRALLEVYLAINAHYSENRSGTGHTKQTLSLNQIEQFASFVQSRSTSSKCFLFNNF